MPEWFASGYPAERCAAAEPLTTYEGQAVLVTEYVSGSRIKGAPGYRALGELMGRLATPQGDPNLVDGTGAGQGPRLWSLAFLLWAVGYTRLTGVDAVISGYVTHAELEPAERERLVAARALHALDQPR